MNLPEVAVWDYEVQQLCHGIQMFRRGKLFTVERKERKKDKVRERKIKSKNVFA